MAYSCRLAACILWRGKASVSSILRDIDIRVCISTALNDYSIYAQCRHPVEGNPILTGDCHRIGGVINGATCMNRRKAILGTSYEVKQQVRSNRLTIDLKPKAVTEFRTTWIPSYLNGSNTVTADRCAIICRSRTNSNSENQRRYQKNCQT